MSERQAAAVLERLGCFLADDEEVRLLVRVSRVNPLLDMLAVTSQRLLGIGSFDVAARGPKLVVDASDLVSWDVRTTLVDPRRLRVRTRRGGISFGNLDRADVETVEAALAALAGRAAVGSAPPA
ncbi:MAG: hypothetical protein ACRDY7_05015 [Acidimicrobiia bacterium]